MDLTGGYIRLYRKLLQNPIWTQLAPAVSKVAVYCILRANYRPGEWYDGTRMLAIPVGSFITSYEKTATACNLSLQQVRDAFAHLERAQFATFERTRRWTLVRIVNYETYQATADGENIPETIHRNGYENRKRTPKEEVKKEITSSLLFPFEPTTPNQDDEDAQITATATRIYQRHPKVRRCGQAEIRSHLAAIIRKLPKSERAQKLAHIEKNHAEWCESCEWKKEGGKYAKGLNNWLAPSKGRYDEGPPPRQLNAGESTYTNWEPPTAAQNG